VTGQKGAADGGIATRLRFTFKKIPLSAWANAILQSFLAESIHCADPTGAYPVRPHYHSSIASHKKDPLEKKIRVATRAFAGSYLTYVITNIN
jgi:hypothetical protein